MIRLSSYSFQGNDTKLSTLYTDKDSFAVNKMHFDILNDTMKIFKLATSSFEDDSNGSKYTVYHNGKCKGGPIKLHIC